MKNESSAAPNPPAATGVSAAPAAGTSTTAAAPVEVKPLPAPKPVECTPEMKTKALVFDRYVQGDLSNAEQRTLIEGCAKDPGANPFCYGVTNSDRLEARLHARPAHAGRHAKVKPKISGNKVVNWGELRADNLNHLIKAFARLSSAKLKIVKTTALAETQCPNNAAIAAAATLEDQLPTKADFGELAELYEKGGDCVTDPDDRESILTRAGLFYYVKKESTKAMAVWSRSAMIEAAKSPRPFYWLFRTQTETGDKAAAATTLAKLKEKFPFSFHTVMARLRDSQDPDDVLSRDTPSPLARSAKSAGASTLVEEAELLRACGVTKTTSKVLDWAAMEAEATGGEPEFRLRLAQMKAEGEEIHQSIFVLSKILIDYPQLVSRKTLELYFPKAFLALFEKHADGLDPFLLLSVARQESAFNPKAVSSARAKGLLQLVMKRKKKRGKDIFDPETNITMGAKMIKDMLGDNDGRLHLALSAYNAGPRKIGLWTKRYPIADPILFIDLIPYKETRAYVALIMRNYYWYRRMYSPMDRRIPWAALNEHDRPQWPELPAIATSATH